MLNLLQNTEDITLKKSDNGINHIRLEGTRVCDRIGSTALTVDAENLI